MNRRNIEDIYPLTPLQQGLLFHALYDPTSRAYFEQSSGTFYGDLNVPVFKRAWQYVVERHPVLRTAFTWDRLDEPLQVVLYQVKLSLQEKDWRGLLPAEQEQQLADFLKADQEQGFELSKAPLLRLALIRLADQAYHFIVSLHHLILDGWCQSLLWQEVLSAYRVLSQGQTLDLERPGRYRDYIIWLQQQDLAQAKLFWHETLKGFTTPTVLGVDQAPNRLFEVKESYNQQELRLPSAITTALQSLARQHHLTVNTLVQGAWALLLSHYGGGMDVTFGITVSGRPPDLAGATSIMGCFTNTLPMRVKIVPEMPLLSWLHQLQNLQVEMSQYEYTPLIEIQEWSELPRGLPLFETILDFASYTLDLASQKSIGKDLMVSNLNSVESTPYPLVLTARLNSELWLHLTSLNSRFDKTTITRMLGNFATLLESMVTDSERCIQELPFLSEMETHRLLVEFNADSVSFPPDRFAHEIIEEQVRNQPDAIAAIFGEESISYAALNERANQIARWLNTQPLDQYKFVGVFGHRGVDLLVMLLATLKAGCVYVPLDPTYPNARLLTILEHSSIKLVTTQASLLDRTVKLVNSLTSTPAIFCWDGISEDPEILDRCVYTQQLKENPTNEINPQDLANVFYTSGSTGIPKGVMIEHEGMLNHLWSKIDLLGMNNQSIVAQTASQAFDISIWQFLTPLMVGGKVVIYDDGTVLDPVQLLQAFERDQVTIVETVPSQLAVLLEVATRPHPPHKLSLTGLQYLISQAETLSVPLCHRWMKRFPHVTLINAYGATECSDDTTHYMMQTPPLIDIKRIPVGKPIPGFQIYLLNDWLQPVPLGCVGQIAMAGIGVGRGYLSNPEKTAQVFVPNPFTDDAGKRLYLSGDLGRWTEEGFLEFVERVDNQVKVRGHRIELGEVEAALARHPNVGQTVVTIWPDEQRQNRLVAYVVPTSKDDQLILHLRSFLKEQLPDFMIPSIFMLLDRMPTTTNGKVDRRALPTPTQKEVLALQKNFVVPATPVEKILANIWGEVLGLEQVSLHDNFFELGGHSLNATQVIIRMNQELDMNLPVRLLFLRPILKDLATDIEKAKELASSDVLLEQKIAELREKLKQLKLEKTN